MLAKVRGCSRYKIDYRPHSRAKGIKILNEDDLFAETWPRMFLPPSSFERGFRTYPITPLIMVSKKLGRALQDFECHSEYWMISNLAKDLLQEVNQDDFNFMAIDAVHDDGSKAEPLWLCHVISFDDNISWNCGMSAKPRAARMRKSFLNIIFNSDMVLAI